MARKPTPNIEFVRTFGARVRQLRLQRRMTQEQLAEAADMSVLAISNIERGINGPRFFRLNNLARALRVDVRDLFRFGDAPPPLK